MIIWIFFLLSNCVITDCIMGGNPISTGKRIGDDSDDSVLDNIFVPISPKDLSLGLPIASHAKPLWLHFWNRLVGNCSQPHCILCRISRKFHFLVLLVTIIFLTLKIRTMVIYIYIYIILSFFSCSLTLFKSCSKFVCFLI